MCVGSDPSTAERLLEYAIAQTGKASRRVVIFRSPTCASRIASGAAEQQGLGTLQML